MTKKEDFKAVENSINQFRGFFQANRDNNIRVNAFRMLDEMEIILKKYIENTG